MRCNCAVSQWAFGQVVRAVHEAGIENAVGDAEEVAGLVSEDLAAAAQLPGRGGWSFLPGEVAGEAVNAGSFAR